MRDISKAPIPEGTSINSLSEDVFELRQDIDKLELELRMADIAILTLTKRVSDLEES